MHRHWMTTCTQEFRVGMAEIAESRSWLGIAHKAEPGAFSHLSPALESRAVTPPLRGRATALSQSASVPSKMPAIVAPFGAARLSVLFGCRRRVACNLHENVGAEMPSPGGVHERTRDQQAAKLLTNADIADDHRVLTRQHLVTMGIGSILPW